MSTRLEHRIRPRPFLLLFQEQYLLVSAPHIERGFGVEVVHRRSWQRHVTGRAEGVGVVNSLNNHYCAPHVAVHEVNMEIGAHQ